MGLTYGAAKVSGVYYLRTCEGETIAFSTHVEDSVDESLFKNGYVAFYLQNEQEDKTIQVWGQTLSGETQDDYPVLTDKAEKKVYQVDFSDNSTGHLKGYANYSRVFGNNGDTIDLVEYAGYDKEYFFGWSETQGGEKYSGNTYKI